MLFISHSTHDKVEALKLQTLLLERGYDPKQLFLDSDEQSGIEAGEKWKQILYERLKDCHVLIVLCSPNGKASQWCFAEFVYADMNGKEIFPVVIADGDIGSIASEHQAVFVTKEGDKAYERLFAALEAKQLGPKDHLPWPHPDLKDANGQPDECPFPGLPAFDERYAAVYFGREPEIQTVLEQLNEMRRKGEPRLLMIVGGSGSGKSSLLKAGVLPRLKHRSSDADWLVLPTLRYGELAHGDNAFFLALAEHIVDRYPASATNKPDAKVLREQFSNSNADQAADAFWESAHDLSRACDCKDAALLLAVDQFEELLSPSSGEMAAKFLRFLRAICQRPNRRLLVIGTMRSDYLDVYEHHKSSLQAPLFKPWRLEPFLRERIADVIVKPATRARVRITDELLERLKEVTVTAEALPLLAFMLEKLYRRSGGDGVLELQEYIDLGGMEGAIQNAINRIIPPGSLSPDTVAALRLSFVKHLAQVNDKDEIVRLTAGWSNLPVTAQPVLEQFVNERLLVKSEHRDEKNPLSRGVRVEVAHEAMFRCWGDLKDWLQKSADILRWRRDIERTQQFARDNKKIWWGLNREQLAVARNWRKHRRDELTPVEISLINKGLFWEGVVLVLVVAVFLVISASAVMTRRQYSKANERAAEALAVRTFLLEKVLVAARPTGQEGGLGVETTIRAAVDAAEPQISLDFQNQPLVEASIRDTLGETYQYLGEAELAIRQHERSRQLHLNLLGPDDSVTLASTNSLAVAYLAAKKLDQALPLFVQTLERRKATLGLDHPDTLGSMNNLAAAYREAGKPDESLSLYKDTLKKQEATLPPDDPETLRTMYNIANAYWASDKRDQALELYKETLTKQKAKLSQDHPGTLRTMHNLAVAYQETDKLDQALPLYEAALKKQQKTLTSRHSDTLQTMHNLASAYKQDIDRLSEAKMPLQGKLRLTEVMQRLIDLYTALDKPDQATEWRKKLEEANLSSGLDAKSER